MRQRLTHDQQLSADAEWLARAPVPVVVLRPTCDTCQAFIADDINPPAGMGRCRRGHMAVYPMQRRHCADHKECIS